jgi:hypothetical protein
VLTKYEALADRVKGEYRERAVTKKDVSKYAKENVIDPLKNANATHPPAAFVQTHREFLLSFVPCKNDDETIQIKAKVVNY